VTVPITGAVGATGAALITTLAEANDIHPASLVTVKVWLPGARFAIVVVVPVPVVPPGLIVQTPVAGRPLNATLPVAAVHEAGCVIVPIIGASTPGASFITTSAEGREIHPASEVMLKL
jgi:hypothetical protein